MYKGSSSPTLFESWLATSDRSVFRGDGFTAADNSRCRLAEEEEDEGLVLDRADILGGGSSGAAPGSGYSSILSVSAG